MHRQDTSMIAALSLWSCRKQQNFVQFQLHELQLICVAKVSIPLGHSQTICFVFNLTNSEITNKISAESVATAKRGVSNAASLIGSSGVGRSYGLYAGACNINSAMYIFRDSGIFRVTRDQKARKTVDMANRSVAFFCGRSPLQLCTQCARG